MVPDLDAIQAGIERGSQWARIDGAISVTANRAVDRAVIEASAAADAAQDFTRGTHQQRASAVVEQYDVKGFGAVGVALALRPAHEADVRGDLLSGSGPSQQAKQDCGILERRHDFLDARHDDMGA